MKEKIVKIRKKRIKYSDEIETSGYVDSEGTPSHSKAIDTIKGDYTKESIENTDDEEKCSCACHFITTTGCDCDCKEEEEDCSGNPYGGLEQAEEEAGESSEEEVGKEEVQEGGSEEAGVNEEYLEKPEEDNKEDNNQEEENKSEDNDELEKILNEIFQIIIRKLSLISNVQKVNFNGDNIEVIDDSHGMVPVVNKYYSTIKDENARLHNEAIQILKKYDKEYLSKLIINPGEFKLNNKDLKLNKDEKNI